MTVSSSRFPRAARAAGLALLAAAALLIAAVLSAPDAASGPAPRPPSRIAPDLAPAAVPNEPAIGLKYFKVDPDGATRDYQLLVIPVLFAGDASVGTGGRDSLVARLTGDTPDRLTGFYRAITFDRIAMSVTVAPTVVTEHPRTWYTSEGENNTGFGLDVAAYPHNSRGLVEEVTRKIAASVDLRRFDNTGDGIVDGLLILHSGPAAPEAITPELPRSLMAAHSFTLDVPVLRGDARVFPYSVASAYDPLGPWAHEVGHLFGLVDLYVPNTFCPGEGLGTWSLMATGANQDGGDNPTGLDAFSLQLLGFEPVIGDDPFADAMFQEGVFLRTFRRGTARGPEYFLVERRYASEPGLSADATLVYSVDETMVDNRTCGRPLVSVRAVVCEDDELCDLTLDDDTSPSLRDRAGEATGLELTFLRAFFGLYEVKVGYRQNYALADVRLLPVRTASDGTQSQRIALTITGFMPLTPPVVSARVTVVSGGPPCVDAPDGAAGYQWFPPSGNTDTSWVVTPCVGRILPPVSARFEIALEATGLGIVSRDTVTLAVNQQGLGSNRLAEFEDVNLAPGRADPWTYDPDDRTWTAEDFGVLADAEILSPWFTVPANGALLLQDEWDLDAVAPDLALDAAEIRLVTQLTSDVSVKPALGWGHTVARGVGNALGGLDALSGTGEREHVFDLSDHAGETVRLAFRAAGDVEAGSGLWRIRRLAVEASAAPGASLALAPDGNGRLQVTPSGPVPDGTRVVIYSGPAPVTPARTLTETFWDGPFTVEADGPPGQTRRFDLLWFVPGGGGGSAGVVTDLPPAPRTLHPPYPNPVRRGAAQTWSLEVPAGSAPGVYDVLLVDVAGHLVRRERIRFDLPGRRFATWDGRDSAGRPVPAGVYFLRVRTPTGITESRRVVVLP